jgi:SAM-dependent methyltransferase
VAQRGQADWWQTLYDDIVAEAFLVRKDQDELRATGAFLSRELNLAPGGSLFDQCCGVGTLSHELGRQGVRVVGVDQSPLYVARAKREAERLGLDCAFHVGDAFTFTPDDPTDAAVNWGTSFGNADDDRNRAMLRRAFETLQPGGRFALDYQHVPRVLRQFQPTLLHRVEGERGETLILRESSVDLPQGTLDQRWTFLLPDGTRHHRRSAVRLYMPHELAGMLRTCGFEDVRSFGGVGGEPLTLDSPRCILVARRPA